MPIDLILNLKYGVYLRFKKIVLKLLDRTVCVCVCVCVYVYIYIYIDAPHAYTSIYIYMRLLVE